MACYFYSSLSHTQHFVIDFIHAFVLECYIFVDTQNLFFSFVIFLFYLWSIKLSCHSPFTKTVSKCGKCMSESSLEWPLHSWCAFIRNLIICLVNSFLLLSPSLFVSFNFLVDSFLCFFAILMFLLNSFQWRSLIFSKFLYVSFLLLFK